MQSTPEGTHGSQAHQRTLLSHLRCLAAEKAHPCSGDVCSQEGLGKVITSSAHEVGRGQIIRAYVGASLLRAGGTMPSSASPVAR